MRYTIRAKHKSQRSVGILFGLLLGFLASAEFLAIAALSQQRSYAQSSSSIQKPLPPSPSSSYKSPLPNPLSGFILTNNTPIKLKFKETISSKTAQENQLIEFEVAEDIAVQGVTVIARGTNAKGIIAEVKRAKMLGRKGKIAIVLKEVALVSGERVSLRSNQSQGGGLSAGTIALSAIVTPFFLFMGGKEAKYPAGTEFTAFVDGDYGLDRAKFDRGGLR
ncbi:hypothetical protein [Altericista sp. CCNU0014]|uniref:hypothetical protein n=1 Tax=Altericista sp. CCNU0014 TaxID=3082949 RepID=UPI00384B5D05